MNILEYFHIQNNNFVASEFEAYYNIKEINSDYIRGMIFFRKISMNFVRSYQFRNCLVLHSVIKNFDGVGVYSLNEQVKSSYLSRKQTKEQQIFISVDRNIII